MHQVYYSGLISARECFGKGFSYIYDNAGRLTKSSSFSPHGGFSTTYAYDNNGNFTSLTRKGIVDIGSEGDYTHDYTDVLSFSYDGNRLVSVNDTGDDPSYAGASGFFQHASDAYDYDAAGNMTKDLNRGIENIKYDYNGMPIEMYFTDGHAILNRYDGLGSLMSSSLYAFPEGESSPIFPDQPLSQCSDRLVRTKAYVGEHVLVNDTCAMTFLPKRSGYINADRELYYWLKDYQGNNIMLVNDIGNLTDTLSYYPYGSPIVYPSFGPNSSPAGSRLLASDYLFSGKELIKDGGFNSYDFGARFLGEGLPVWNRPDPLCEQTPGLSPYAYCANNPIMLTDPNGCKIQGASKRDANLVIEDIREMFVGDEFESFRNLIVKSDKKHDGKSIAPISSEDLSQAFSGINLNEDQQALVEMVVNTINSKDTHMIEYTSNTGLITKEAQDVFLPMFMEGQLSEHMPYILKVNGGLPVAFIINVGGGGVTTSYKNGSYSLIILGGDHPNGRAVTTGHEILGHGRSMAAGIGKSDQHEQSVRTENLIRRVMGIPGVNTGENHGPRVKLLEPSLLPSFR